MPGRLWLPTLALCTLGAQEPAWVQLALAGDPGNSSPPALAWLRHDVLCQRPEWPAELPAGAAIAFRWTPTSLRIWRSQVLLPEGVAMVGEFAVPGREPIRVACEQDGVEEWTCTAGGTLPERLRRLAHLLGVSVTATATPPTLDLAAALGNLAGPAAVGDPFRELLQQGATSCGELTWSTWSRNGEFGVRGRSDGGLLLPASLLLLATVGEATIDDTFWQSAPTTFVERWSMRAYSRRDGDRAEATRQLVRSDNGPDRETLLDMLHADEGSRLAAIDALVRRGDQDTLPAIIRAAEGSSDLVAGAAVDAMESLWPHARNVTRASVRKAVSQSTIAALHERLARLPTAAPRLRPEDSTAERSHAWRMRLLIGLLILSVCLHGLWRRECARLAADG
ncbi:MAG: hypothetical protein IPK26_28800 [Planctomycetes bacterium]|nr:hypothetical protein [Planctomycetota bacterium]